MDKTANGSSHATKVPDIIKHVSEELKKKRNAFKAIFSLDSLVVQCDSNIGIPTKEKGRLDSLLETTNAQIKKSII